MHGVERAPQVETIRTLVGGALGHRPAGPAASIEAVGQAAVVCVYERCRECLLLCGDFLQERPPRCTRVMTRGKANLPR